MVNRLALGTAQFGSDYGINNKSGQVPKDEAFRMLDLCSACGIDTIDTASGYGDSERILGEYISKNRGGFKIVSKFPASYGNDPETAIKRTFDKVRAGKLYGYLFHDVRTFAENEKIWGLFSKMKSEGKVDKIGFSLYYPKDLRDILDKKIAFDILQIPYNIFDRRFEPYFAELKEKAVEIHVRSIFLQGLVFKDPSELEGKLEKMKPKLERLRKMAGDKADAIARICFTLVSSRAEIDRVVVGVDSIANLKELVEVSRQRPSCDIEELKYFIEPDEDMILPFNWRA